MPLLKENDNYNYTYYEFINKQFSSTIIDIKIPISESSLVANSRFEWFKKQIEDDIFLESKILELRQKLFKIKSNLKINKKKIISNLAKQKKNKIFNFIINFFSLGKINKNKEINNKISNVKKNELKLKELLMKLNLILKR